MRRSTHRPTDADCTVRTYEPGDADRFRSLYETVWGTSKSREWFEWRFRAPPTADRVAMVVAERDGRLVGAEPLVPYQLRVGERSLDAYQPVDWIVHPDHRREGIFSAMTAFLLDAAAEDAALLFNFPNEQLRPGVERFGWEVIDTASTRYRVQRPTAAVAAGSSRRSWLPDAALATAGSPVVRGGLGLLDRVGSPPKDVAVERVEGVPIETVHALYREHVPDRVHVPRDRDYLAWRFANPRWETTTYVARRGGEAVGSAIVATESIAGSRLARIFDVQPMTDDRGDAPAFEAMLDAVVSDHTAADVLAAPGGIHPAVFRRYGFVSDDAVPVSWVTSTTYHAIRPLGEASLAVGTGDAVQGPEAASRPAGRAREGAITDGSGVATDAQVAGGADAPDCESAAPVERDDSDRIDLSNPDAWVLGLGDRDVA